MEQGTAQSAIMMSMTVAQFAVGVGAIIVIVIGGVWAVNGAFLNELKTEYRIMRTQMDGLHIAMNSLTVAMTEIRASMPILDRALQKMLDDRDRFLGEIASDLTKLRGEIDEVNGNVVRITTFLAHLAGTPPSFPSDQAPA